MNRAERRKAESQARRQRDHDYLRELAHERIQAIMSTDGDNCTICRARFQHNTRSYGGVTDMGTVALTSDCCASQLAVTLTSGLYISRRYPELPTAPYRQLSSAEIEEAVAAHQERYAAIDPVIDDAARRAGISPERSILRLDDDEVPWKADDRAWFERNTSRSHRLRKMFPGEPTGQPTGVAPPGHELMMLVKQVAPGQRIRLGFFCNSEIGADFPDYQPMAAALFDIIAARTKATPVSVHELVELARKYEQAGSPQ